jgi:alpha-L-rhamnosidase
VRKAIITRFGLFALLILLATAAGQAAASGAPAAGLRITRLVTEYAHNPLGIDVARPRLSWTLDSPERDQAQTAYRVVVASSADKLARDTGDVWDSGKASTGESVNVPYGGPALASRTRYFWKVRVWDAHGTASNWSSPAWWETALLQPSDWHAQWIGATPSPMPTLDGATWIWYPEGDPAVQAPAGTRYFRRQITIPDGKRVVRAHLLLTADNQFTASLNGARVAASDGTTNAWQQAVSADLTPVLNAGRNTLSVAATNATISPAGLIGALDIDFADGTNMTVRTDGDWKTADKEATGWADPTFDDSGWPAALPLKPYGQSPWGRSVELPRPPDPLLRTTFPVTKQVRQARVYMVGLGYHELRLNGRKVGDNVLETDVNDYSKRVGYSTYDVTDYLRHGANAAGVMLGSGFYDVHQATPLGWEQAPWRDDPKMLFQMEIRYTDGTTETVLSDPGWQSADGPITYDSVFGGEDYDARLENRGWDTPSFDTATASAQWRSARIVAAPGGRLVATNNDPVRVEQTLRPVTTTEPKPGVYVLDMGHTITGWGRLTVSGTAGTAVTLRYGQRLLADGTVDYLDAWHGGRSQTDGYILKGGGTETWEPRFTFKSFRYLQVTGLPSAPQPDTVVGRFTHSAVGDAGSFSSSSELYNTFHDGMRRTILGSLEGYPAVDPFYEKSGWTEDVSVSAQSQIYNFDMARFFTEWLDDIRDSQQPNGQLPIIIPSPGWGYTSWGTPSPVWTAVYPIMAWRMYQNYGDRRVLEEHYPTIKKYLDWEISRLQDGIATSALTDYMAPGYNGNPPEDGRLAGTAYIYRQLTILADIAQVLGQTADTGHYRQIADVVRDRFNAMFLNTTKGQYETAKDPGYRQTSNLLPLAFGMVPEAYRQRVLDGIVADVHARGDHLNTGTLGTEVILPVLTENGHADLANAIASQRTYPSWGYWYANGADTMWEAWGLTARSRAHFFMGMVDEWFYRDLAGITTDPARPGYQHIVIRPYPDSGPERVRASHTSPYGQITSAWVRTGNGFRLTVTVPVNTTATVCVPAAQDATVTGDGRPMGRRDGCAYFEVGSGTYHFSR